MPRKRTSSKTTLRITAIILFVFSVSGLLGELEFTALGKAVFAIFRTLMGNLAWLGPLLTMVASIIAWLASKKNNKNRLVKPYSSKLGRKKQQQSGSILLPKGKLVTLQGFNKYFSSPEWAEIESSAVEDFNELGRDFSTYFREGQEFSLKPLSSSKLTSIKGFERYFSEVDEEIHREKENYQFIPLSTKPIAGQVAHLVNRGTYNSKASLSGVTPSEREVLIGKPKSTPDLDLQSYRTNLSVIFFDKESEKVNGSATVNTDIANNDTVNAVDKQAEFVDKTKAEIPNAMNNEAQKEKSQVDPGGKTWVLPQVNLLEPLISIPLIQDTETQKQLEKVLTDFGVQAKIIRVTRGPVITRFELAPAPGVKISRIVNLADDIALALAARDVRIEAPIPGKAAIGIEVPNKKPRTVSFREVLETSAYKQNPSKLRVALGKDIADQPVIADLSKMPHLLVAGATGSGKSVCISALINSLLFNATPDEVKFLLVDPKMVELSIYNGIPHLLAPVVTDPKKAATALKWIVKEMETRYELFAASGVRDIERFNKLKASESSGQVPALPWIVVIIDELADLMMVAANDVEEAICRLAQMARAAGIHLVIATQRPSVDVITGVIKANIPSRISFAVSSQIDSRTILDATGAEKLLGRGDMLYSPQGLNKPLRVQGCLVTDEEAQRIIKHWQEQGKPEYLDPERLLGDSGPRDSQTGPDDELFMEAARLIIESGMASVSFLQRRLKLGYARAARLMDMLEEYGIVGGYEGSKPRQILISLEEFNERFG